MRTLERGNKEVQAKRKLNCHIEDAYMDFFSILIVCVCTYGGREVSALLELELWEMVSHSTVVLGTEFRSSARAVYKLPRQEISAVPVVSSVCKAALRQISSSPLSDHCL